MDVVRDSLTPLLSAFGARRRILVQQCPPQPPRVVKCSNGWKVKSRLACGYFGHSPEVERLVR